MDLNVILTAHDETLVCGPTMQAAQAAIDAARAGGFTVAPVIVLDAATPACKAWFDQPAFDGWERMVLEEGDLGRARNAAVARTGGDFIAFLDADDLISENWLLEGARLLRSAAERGEKRVIHPELNWLFDGWLSVYHKPDQDDVLFTPWYFYVMNYYDSMCMAPRALHEQVPYASRDIPNGLSYQDWQFSIETMAAGWRHMSAKDTVIFKRRRDASLVTESRIRRAVVRALPPMKIEDVTSLGAPHASDAARASAEARALEARALENLGNTPDAPGTILDKLRAIIRPVRSATSEDENTKPVSRIPHGGSGLEARVEFARGRGAQDPARDTPGYDLVASEFDYAYYLSAYPDLVQARKVDPVGHFIRRGVVENRRPAPYFGPRQYLSRYPKAADDPAGPLHHYLSEGRAKGQITAQFDRFEELAAMLGLTPLAVQTALQDRHADLVERLEYGTLGDMVARAAAFEPLVAATWPHVRQVGLPPFQGNVIVDRTVAVYALAQAAQMRGARRIIVVNRARWGGARRMEGHIAHALAATGSAEDVMLISTDKQGALPPGRLPEGVRHVDFAALVGNLEGDEAQRVLVQFLRSLSPEVVFNINSGLLWQALVPYGRALRASTRLIGCLFCNEQTPLGHPAGYPLSQVYRHFELLQAIVTDSHALADELRGRHMLPPEMACKIQVLSAPVDATLPQVAPAKKTGLRPQVFWAGRFDAQKRVDLVYAIARARPDIDIRMWGAPVMGQMSALPARPHNVMHEGTYAHFSDLPLDEADVWLYTSAWDGVPSMVLEVAMTGLPIVGSNVGGTAEVLQPDLAEAIPPHADADAYSAAIDRVLADPHAARARADALRSRLIAQRTEAAYAKDVAALADGDPR